MMQSRSDADGINISDVANSKVWGSGRVLHRLYLFARFFLASACQARCCLGKVLGSVDRIVPRTCP